MRIRVEKLGGENLCKVLEEIRAKFKGRVGSVVVHTGVVKASGEAKPPLVFGEEFVESLEEELRPVAGRLSKLGGLLEVRVYHSSGELDVGEVVLYVVAAAETRSAAFNAAREVLEEIKKKHARLLSA